MKKSKKTIMKELDKKWADDVKARDGYKCAMCGKTEHLNSHHVIPRQIRSFRHDLRNGLTLCPRCHSLGAYCVHQNALFFSMWFIDNRKEDYNYLMEKLHMEILND